MCLYLITYNQLKQHGLKHKRYRFVLFCLKQSSTREVDPSSFVNHVHIILVNNNTNTLKRSSSCSGFHPQGHIKTKLLTETYTNIPTLQSRPSGQWRCKDITALFQRTEIFLSNLRSLLNYISTFRWELNSWLHVNAKASKKYHHFSGHATRANKIRALLLRMEWRIFGRSWLCPPHLSTRLQLIEWWIYL